MLAKRLKDIEASGRASAKMLGVDESTVRKDVSAGNPAPTWFQNTELNPAAWQAAQAAAKAKADGKRSAKLKGVPKGDRAPTVSGQTIGSAGAKAKASASSTNRGSVERMDLAMS